MSVQGAEEVASRKRSKHEQRIGGIAGWLLNRMRGRLWGIDRKRARLELLERIALAPRQSLALIEAEGRRILVATSAEGSPAFYPLDTAERSGAKMPARRQPRVSW
jgi:flagellar biogenesis protein FliO